MSLIKSIQNAPITAKENDDLAPGMVSVRLTVHGLEFCGHAFCHPEDMDFYSRRVGFHIAHARAIIQAIAYYRYEAYQKWQILRRAYADAMQNQEQEDVIFLNSVRQAEWQYHKLQKAIKEARTELHKYLEAQTKFVQSVRHQREAKQN